MLLRTWTLGLLGWLLIVNCGVFTVKLLLALKITKKNNVLLQAVAVADDDSPLVYLSRKRRGKFSLAYKNEDDISFPRWFK